MTLMQRRRALMAQKPSGEQWDYVWNYTDGMPEDNGATKVTNGSFTINMTSDGLSITTSTSGQNYVAYRFPDYQSDAGTIECEFIMPASLTGFQNIRIGYADGSDGFQTAAKGGNITPLERDEPYAYAKLGEINNIRVEWLGSKGAFWLNGTLVGDNQNATQYSANTQVMVQATDGKIITLRTIRIRKE